MNLGKYLSRLCDMVYRYGINHSAFYGDEFSSFEKTGAQFKKGYLPTMPMRAFVLEPAVQVGTRLVN